MFDVFVTGRRSSMRRGAVPLAISWAVHALAITVIVALPLLFATKDRPDVPEAMVAFVAVAPAPPPPPPPPPPAATATKPATPWPSPRPTPSAPKTSPSLEVPARVEPPPAEASIDELAAAGNTEGGIERGVPGGVAGGVLGGVLGGVIGGMLDAPPPPPPPPQSAPIRTGGELKAPALIKRVPPVYPPLAVSAEIEGTVILEATVGKDGRVEDVRVLRSVGVFDRAAINAVRQWEYAPLLLNGTPERFILTVTVSFNLS
jgi:protein TonB